jgi:hypothetical protein
VTIELDYTKMTSPSQLENLWQYNWRSLLGYLEHALFGVHGTVRDVKSSKPVPAGVFILAHDKDSSQVYSDSITGNFTRLLLPGTYKITFFAAGYRDTTVSNIVVPYREAANIVVNMEPLTTPADTTYPYLPFIYPNPSESVIKCILPEKLYGNLKIMVIDQSGKKAMDYNEHYSGGDKLEIYVGGLPAGSYFIVFRNLSTGYHATSRIIVTGRFNR